MIFFLNANHVLPPLLGAAKHGYVLGARSSRGVN